MATKSTSAPKAPRKSAVPVYFEMGGVQLELTEIQKAIKTVSDVRTAYVNTDELAVYCVCADGHTEKVEL